jgi:DNA-binding MarR family transcriptional regulator
MGLGFRIKTLKSPSDGWRPLLGAFRRAILNEDGFRNSGDVAINLAPRSRRRSSYPQNEPTATRREERKVLQRKSKAHAADKSKQTRHSYTLDDAPGFLLRVALRTHTSIFTAKMIEGLTAPQFSTLAKLREVGPCSQNHLGRLIHYDSATITGVITRLKTRGLITSYEDPLDLTEKGRRIADAAIETIGEISSETFSPLSQQEFRTLTEILKKVIRR